MRRLLWVLMLCPAWALAQVYATVDATSGPVHIVSADGSRTAAAVGQTLSVGQTVQTQADGELHAVTQDGGFLAVRPNTTLQMLQYRASQDDQASMTLSLVRGALRSITGWIGKLNPSGYRVNTPTATVGIRGTDHETVVLEHANGRDAPGTYDTVLEGATVVRSAQGEIHLQAGEHGYAARDGAAPPRRLAERPEFLGQRLLQLEDRIKERKTKLTDRLQQAANDNPELARRLRDRMDNATDEQREAVRKRLLRKTQRNRND